MLLRRHKKHIEEQTKEKVELKPTEEKVEKKPTKKSVKK